MESAKQLRGPVLYHDMTVGTRRMAEETRPGDAYPGYSVVPITGEDAEETITFLRRFFFRDEPLNLAIGLLDDQPTCNELEQFCLASIPEGLSLKAVTPDGEIIGVCLNGLEHDGDGEKKECTHPKFRKILGLLGRVHDEVDIHTRYPGIKILDIRVASVHVDHRGRGIARALFDATRQMAKERGFKLVKVDCSSHFTALAVAKLGFKCIYSLDYKDHLGEDGKPVFVPELPHTTFTTYVIHVD